MEEKPPEPQQTLDPGELGRHRVDATSSEPQLWTEERRWPSRRLLVIGAVTLLAVAGAIIAAVVSHGSGSPSAVGASISTAPNGALPCSSYKGMPPQSCVSKTGYYCISYNEAEKPLDCFGGSATARKRAIAREKVVERSRAAVIARHAAADARRAKIEAAAEAWHAGYFQQDSNVYWKWVDGKNCQDFVQHGCWHVQVITDAGCPSYVAVNANEYKRGTIINQLLDNQGYGIPPRTPRLFELDADAEGVIAKDVRIDCS